MNGKERLRRSLDHQDGPIPMDFGSTSVTGIHCSIVASLREYYGLEKQPVRVIEPYQMLGELDTELQDTLGIDVTGVFPRGTMFGFPLEAWKEWRTPWGQEVLVPGKFNTVPDGKDLLIYPGGDTGAPPSGRMPEGGFFFDTIIRQPPIVEEALDPRDNLEEFGEITDETLDFIELACREAGDSGKGVIANFGGTAFGDIALVPAPNLKNPKGIRDITEWYISTVSRQDYIHAVFKAQAEIALGNLARIHRRVGDIPDAVFICGTDFGTQDSQFCSTATFDALYAPYYRKVNDWIHANTGWKTFKHSCGAVEQFMDNFISAGFDIINPVQCSAAGMEPRRLKDRYGTRFTFWGGGVDTQKTLPFGTPEEVRREVLERLEIFSRGGGYVFDAIHNVQAATPIENIVALFETVRTWRG